MRAFLVSLLILTVVGCPPYPGSDQPLQEISGYAGSSSRYDSNDPCIFQTRHGPVAGYKRSGKDRCCVNTREGPSCQ